MHVKLITCWMEADHWISLVDFFVKVVYWGVHLCSVINKLLNFWAPVYFEHLCIAINKLLNFWAPVYFEHLCIAINKLLNFWAPVYFEHLCIVLNSSARVYFEPLCIVIKSSVTFEVHYIFLISTGFGSFPFPSTLVRCDYVPLGTDPPVTDKRPEQSGLAGLA